MRVYSQRHMTGSSDPDAGLYDGFLQDEDRTRCQQLHEKLANGIWQDLDYQDGRLHTLAQRMKARSFTGLLEQDDLTPWREFVVDKLTGQGDWLGLAQFESRTQTLLEEAAREHEVDEGRVAVLTSLLEHAADLRHRYQL